MELLMRYALYCFTVFTIIFGFVAIYMGTSRTHYRKRFSK